MSDNIPEELEIMFESRTLEEETVEEVIWSKNPYRFW